MSHIPTHVTLKLLHGVCRQLYWLQTYKDLFQIYCSSKSQEERTSEHVFRSKAGWQLDTPVGEEQEGFWHDTRLQVWKELHSYGTGTADSLPTPETQMAASAIILRTAICT